MTAATITLNPGTGGDKPLVDTLTTVDGGAAPAGASAQMVKIGVGVANDFRTLIAEPFGALQVNNGFQTLFYDSWSTALDTVDKWTVTGNAPTIANGNMTMPATLSSYNAIRTKDNIRSNVGFTLVRNGVSLESAVATGAGRFWGLGTTATTPAAAVLVQDGVGFELDQATGALLAVTYSAGVRTTIATLTRPADGLTHGYGCFFRVTQAFWLIDGVLVASKSFPDIMMAELPALIVRQNAAAFVGTPAFVNIAHLTADSSRQSAAISDPVIGTRQARVAADGSLRVSDNELRATTLWVSATGVAGAAVTLTLPAAAAGLFHYVTSINMMLYATAARTGSATPTVVTTTNLPGSPAWVFMTAQVIGAMDNYDVPLLTPLKSSVAATATTVVAPIATGGLWRINVGYYTGA